MTKLQQELIAKITTTEDALLLQEVRRILEMGSSDEEVFHMTPEMEAEIALSEEEIAGGEYLTNEAANEEIASFRSRESGENGAASRPAGEAIAEVKSLGIDTGGAEHCC